MADNDVNSSLGSSAAEGQPDRENGEYQFKSGYTSRIYADAHFVPADENTVPPKFYTPPCQPEKNTKTGAGRQFPAWVKLVCLCLVCALLGGVSGAALVRKSCESALNELRQSVDGIEKRTAGMEADMGDFADFKAAVLGEENENIPAADIYAMACEQVVGISTKTTSTGFFGMSRSSDVTGSGFFISDNGYVLTNYHVVEYAYENDAAVTVTLHDGTEYEAAVVGVEESSDIAVLKIDAEGTPAAGMGSSTKLKVGDSVFAVGNPLGELEYSMTFGRVSALDRQISTSGSSGGINMFQFDAAVNKGNSGGPLYDERGRVVGVVTAKASSTGVEGIGFALPIDDILPMTKDLITKGYVSGKAYLGVEVDKNYGAMYSRYFNMPMGAYVGTVVPGSAADRAGMKLNDIIIRIGEQEISSYNDLKNAVRGYSAGDTTQIVVYRSGDTIVLDITFDEALPEKDS